MGKILKIGPPNGQLPPVFLIAVLEVLTGNGRTSPIKS